jgi:hypothetical protein
VAPRVDLVPWLLAGAAMLAFAIQSLRAWWIAGAPARRVRVSSLRGAEGEARAEELLADRGYSIEARQVAQEFQFLVDGEARAVTVRADLLVTRAGRRFVAEVKTGTTAPRPEHPPTRRQLLEYRHAFLVDGVLLVQPEEGAIREIDFPIPTRTGTSLGWIVLAFLVGAAATMILTRFS